MLTICISWPLSDKTESSFALYGPLSEQSRRGMQNLALFPYCDQVQQQWQFLYFWEQTY